MNLKQRAAVILLDDNKNILLMHRLKNGKEYYAILGGCIEDEESPEETAVRELKEETNLDISLGKMLWEFEDEYHHGYYFLADKYAGTATLGGPELEGNNKENFYELQWVPIRKLNEMLLYPERSVGEFRIFF